MGGVFSSIGSFFGRVSGGYVGPGQVVRVNEQRGGAELLRMGSQGGTVIPLGQANAVVRQKPQQPVVIQVTADEGRMFVPRVQQISGGQTVQIVQQAAPQLIKASSAQTRQDLRRDAGLKL